MSLIDPHYWGELSEVQRDPRLMELAMRQHIARSEFSAKQAQEFVRLALTIRKELDRKEKP